MKRIKHTRVCVSCDREKLLEKFVCTSRGKAYYRRKCHDCYNAAQHPKKPTNTPRTTTRLCNTCGSQPWRVEGKRCVDCGLEYAPEQPATAADLHSPMGGYTSSGPRQFRRAGAA